MLEPVGILWRTVNESVTWSGRITLSRPLPAGISLQVVAVPRPLRSKTKEKYDLHIEIPFGEPLPEPPELNDIFPRGMRMPGPPNSWFKPPEASHRRNKILIFGASGTGKSLAALTFPKASYIDNHGSVEKYMIAYPDHLFASLVKPDDIMGAVAELLQYPRDRRTCVLDDMTVYWERLQVKWEKLFLSRLPTSKGHHAEFYTFQPSDWQHPKRELRTLVRRLLLLDMNVIVIARSGKEYAGEGGEFMKVIGETFVGEKNLPYEFDYVFQFVMVDGKRFARTHLKQRQTPGVALFPSEFEFHIDANGRCDFFEVFSKFDNPENYTREAHQVEDPDKEEVFPTEASAAMATEAPGDKPAIEPVVVTPHEAPTVSPAPAPPPEGTSPVLSPAQLDVLVGLKAQFKIENKEWGDTLLKFYNVKTAKVLTPEQADHFTNYLQTQRVPF